VNSNVVVDRAVLVPPDDAELLVAMADLCGFFPPAADEQCRRLKLLRSLQSLSAYLGINWDEQEAGTAKEDGAKSSTTSSVQLLMELEERVAGARRDAYAFLETVAEDRSEMILLRDELLQQQQHQPEHLVCPWNIFAVSLVSRYLLQSQREETMVQSLQEKLDGLYSGDSEYRKASDIVQATMECLGRQALLRHYQYREGVTLVQQLLQSGGRLATDEKNPDKQPSLCVSHDQQSDYQDLPVSSKACDARVNPALLGATSAWGVFEAFLRSDPARTGNNDAPFFATSVLIVGSEGTGKTHICNEMEHAVSSSTMGKYSES